MLPEPPDRLARRVTTVPPAGSFWRIWHPSGHVRAGALALFRKAAIGPIHAQHRLIDDALWRHLVWTLDSVDTAVERVPASQCGRCQA